MRAKKHLGQHFLRNKKILELICDAAQLSERDTVLEIGPGTGFLTEVLAKKAGKVIAVEKDRELLANLSAKFRDTNVKIIQGDALKMKPERTGLKKYKIVANIPYYITSRFLRTFLEAKTRPVLIVLMVQYEVACRIAAKPGEESVLSLSVKAYGKPEFIAKVSKTYFRPRPKVDSAIIKISDISDKWFRGQAINPKKFFYLVKKAFGQKRKMLRGSLKGLLIPEKCRQARPETLEMADWAKIYEMNNL